MREIERPILCPDLVEDQDTEQAVLGYLMLNSAHNAVAQLVARIDVDCFRGPKQRYVFEAIVRLVEQNEDTDMMHVWPELQKFHHEREAFGYEVLPLKVDPADLANWTDLGRAQNVDLLIETLRDLKVRRTLQLLAKTMEVVAKDMTRNMTSLVNDTIKQLDCLDLARLNQSIPLHEVLPELRQRIEENLHPDTAHHGPYIGLDEVDNAGGLPETGLVVLAGGTSSGKSSVAAGILLHSADADMRGAYISLEMTNRSLVSRMTAMRGRGISGRDLLNRPLVNDVELAQALGDIDKLDERYGDKIFFDDSRSSNLEDICSVIHHLAYNEGIRVAVVDFIQLLNFTMQGRAMQSTTEQLMGQASRTLKNLADRLGICIVMLSQLNRSMDRQRPSLGGVRDSGQIAEAADMVILTWRPEQYQGSYDLNLAKYSPKSTMAVLVAKNREGALMDIIARWDGPRTLMRQLSSIELSEVSGERGHGVMGSLFGN